MSKLLILLLCLGLQVQAQDSTWVLQPATTIVDTAFVNLMPTSPIDESLYIQSLLPHKMLFTQRVFWGPNGLLRVLNIAPLTPEGREKERKVRLFMMIAHQVTGFATLAGFVVQGILDAKLNNATGGNYSQLYKARQTAMTITNIAYGTTALLSLTAPPKLSSDQKRVSGVQLHKYLSIIHLTGFIATNILASRAAQRADLRPYQQVAAFTTFAAFAPALIALKF
ncbi:hypothetical protein [Spirosoma flavum]|uniref:DUF4149 domain-containing protein n=1 Tax=Spirosoma flavum TaxID=2048557 RepID=A0ABW6AT85_9BACT